jgi:hypothetical protein
MEPLGQRPKGSAGGVDRADMVLAAGDERRAVSATPTNPPRCSPRFWAMAELKNPLGTVAALDNSPTIVQSKVRTEQVVLGDGAGQPVTKGKQWPGKPIKLIA